MFLRVIVGMIAAGLAAAQNTSRSGSPDDGSRFRPAAEADLLRMRDRADVAGMRRHAWNVVEQITRQVVPGKPAWQTWRPSTEIFQKAGPQGQGLELKEQSDLLLLNDLRASGLDLAQEVVSAIRALPDADKAKERIPLSSIRFNPTAERHIVDHMLNQPDHLWEVVRQQSGSYETPAIPEFPREALVVKAAWWIISKDGLATMPVWDPPNLGPEPRLQNYFTSTTWHRCVAIDPTSNAPIGSLSDPRPCAFGDQPRRLQVVPLSRFYSIPLTAQMIAHFSANPLVFNADADKPGYAVLVGLHITTKEIPDWVWMTLWWHDRPRSGPYAANRPDSLRKPWANYLMDTTMSADTPHESDDQPKICFNPWLEGGKTLGTIANCLTCHRKASFPVDPNHDVSGEVTRGNSPAPHDTCAVLLDFLWSFTELPTPAGYADCAKQRQQTH